MSGHTPGPWCLDTGAIYAACQLDERGMTSEDPIAEVGDGRPENYLSNCRLIAAAPDLLEALRSLVPQSERVQGPDLQTLEMAKAAIFKATGATA